MALPVQQRCAQTISANVLKFLDAPIQSVPQDVMHDVHVDVLKQGNGS